MFYHARDVLSYPNSPQDSCLSAALYLEAAVPYNTAQTTYQRTPEMSRMKAQEKLCVRDNLLE